MIRRVEWGGAFVGLVLFVGWAVLMFALGAREFSAALVAATGLLAVSFEQQMRGAKACAFWLACAGLSCLLWVPPLLKRGLQPWHVIALSVVGCAAYAAVRVSRWRRSSVDGDASGATEEAPREGEPGQQDAEPGAPPQRLALKPWQVGMSFGTYARILDVIKLLLLLGLVVVGAVMLGSELAWWDAAAIEPLIPLVFPIGVAFILLLVLEQGGIVVLTCPDCGSDLGERRSWSPNPFAERCSACSTEYVKKRLGFGFTRRE